jgi:hypothetical protein
MHRKDFLKYGSLATATAALSSAGLPGCAAPQNSYTSYEQVQNVLDYGADRSGNADSSDAVLEAIDALGSEWNESGGTVHFPQGIYRLASPVRLDTSARLKVRFTGAGIKDDVSVIYVEGDYGFDCNMGSLSPVYAPAFERLNFIAQSAEAVAIRFFMVNHSYISQCHFEDFAFAVEYDANWRVEGRSSDASYHVVANGSRFRNNRTAVRVTEEGGFEMFGGHIVLRQDGDVGVDIYSGWQHRLFGTKFDGDFNGGYGTGIGIRTKGDMGRFVNFQTEALATGVLVEAGEHNLIDGFFSNGGDQMVAVEIMSEASNTVLGSGFASLRQNNQPVKNHSSTTKRSALESVEVG